MKKIFSIFIVLLLIGCATETTPQTPEQKQEDIKIGAILFLTGNDYGFAAEGFREGIDLAVEEINAKGGVLGKKLTVIYEDDQLNSQKAATAANKLVNIDEVDASLIGLINTAHAAVPIFSEAKTPLVILWDAKIPGIGFENMPYLFGPGFSTLGAGHLMANFTTNKLKLDTVAIVRHPDEWSNLISDAFAEQFKANGGKIAIDEQVDLTETDFKTAILKARTADAIYFPIVANIDVFMKRARELGYKGVLLSGDAVIDPLIQSAGTAAEGMFFTQIEDPNTPNMNKLKEAYKKKYGKETDLGPFVALGYDDIYLLAEAIKQAGSTDGTAIKDAMYGIKDLDGALGPITIDDFGGAAKLEKVFTVKDGKQVLVE